MRWGRKQQQEQKKSSSSSFSFSLSNPFSWISKLKQIATKHKSQPARSKQSHPTPRSPPPLAPSRARSASFHDAGDAPHRLSVGEDDTLLARARTSHARALLRSARHNSVGDLDWRPFSSCRPDFELTESRSVYRRWPRDLLSTTASESERSENGPVVVRRRRPRRRRSKPRRSDCGGASEETEGIPPPPRLKPIETGCEARKSFSGKIRHRNKPRVRVYSPRPAASRAEICRARTAAAARKRAAAAAAAGEENGGLEGFAVVKCSCDPQKDFRDSMVEMIWERGIGRPEELERLLACYLSLNSDEHHDVIVKVFRQLWFDLNPERFASCPSHRFD